MSDDQNPLRQPARPIHEAILMDLTDAEYQQWRHSPVTSAYLQYLRDWVEVLRTAVADLLEAGTLEEQASVIRGRLLTLRELQDLSLRDIRNFYRQEEAGSDDGNADEAGAGTSG